MLCTAASVRLILQALAILLCARAAAGAMLLDRHMHLSGAMAASAMPHKTSVQGQQACAELANHGTYFTVDVQVGTPGQRFSVVADTGSNTLIVPSCICQQAGYCSMHDRCFTGTNKSSSFTLMRDGKEPISMMLSFGSGEIRGVLAQEEVKVGGSKASRIYMKEGLMLMTGKALNFGGSFEGILGLGIPAETHKHSAHRQNRSGGTSGRGTSGADGQADPYASQGTVGQQDMSKIIDWLKEIVNGASDQRSSSAQVVNASDSAYVWETGQPMPWIAGVMDPQGTGLERDGPPGFLEQAGINRFGICFNEGESGVLRLGTPSDDAVIQHGSVGTMHWGLGMSGISLSGGGTGGSTTEMVHLAVCNASDMRPGQDTPCGAIPDSGTTLITGPKEGVSVLLDTVCENWPRCKSNYTALMRAKDAAEKAAAEKYGFTPFTLPMWPMSKVLELLLMDCESWLDESRGLAELPSLHFQVTGSTGTRQTLDMPPHAYIMENSLADLKDRLKRSNSTHSHNHSNTSASGASLRGLHQPSSEDAFSSSGAAAEYESLEDSWLRGRSKVCSPAFSVLDYDTERNGPVWILGMPFFYEYNVGYDLSTKPPSMSLQSTKQTPCGSCSDKVGLVTEDAQRDRKGSSARHRQPLRINGVPRKPSFDVDKPL